MGKRFGWYYHGKMIELDVRAFGWNWQLRATWERQSYFGTGRKIVFCRCRCVCEWYGPDLYDGCSSCGREATPAMIALKSVYGEDES